MSIIREVLIHVKPDDGKPIDGAIVMEKPIGEKLDPVVVSRWLDHGIEPPLQCLQGQPRVRFFSTMRSARAIIAQGNTTPEFARKKWPMWSINMELSDKEIVAKGRSVRNSVEQWRQNGRDTNWGWAELKVLHSVLIEFDDQAQIDDYFGSPTYKEIPEDDPEEAQVTSALKEYYFPYWDLLSASEVAAIRDQDQHVDVDRNRSWPSSVLVNFDAFDVATYPALERFAISD